MKYKILYVEDEVETRRNVSEYIKNNYNLTVFEASDGIEGFDSYLKNKPDIIITDISMGKSSGIELIEKIREFDQEVKIVILSGYSEKEKLLKAIKLNIVEYLIKPVTRTLIRECLDNILNLMSVNKSNFFYFNDNSYFDLTSELLFINNLNVKVTKTETELLHLFIDNSNKTLESIDIYNAIWDFEKDYKVESIRTLIKKIRRKLPENSISNIYGGGYRLNLNRV